MLADRMGPLAMQIYNGEDNGVGPLPMSEDCLTLSVWTPDVASPTPLPVMVWIHGGGYVNGSATAALYNGAALAKDGVVVVGVNYRLGRFGFFAHPLLTADEPEELKGNYALMDQIAALKWVQRNITGVQGGDPGNVAIFGESAGGMSINRLMVSPLPRGCSPRRSASPGAGRETGTPFLREGGSPGRGLHRYAGRQREGARRICAPSTATPSSTAPRRTSARAGVRSLTVSFWSRT